LRKKFDQLVVCIELIPIFIGLPVLFSFVDSRWKIHATLWVVDLYALLILSRSRDFSWRTIWQGQHWDTHSKRWALIRFIIAIPLIIGMTLWLVPDRLFSFPAQRPVLWLAVMCLYPVLSVVPQEFLFRTFFFQRYARFFPEPWPMIIISGLSFGFVHIIFHNWIAPILSIIGGLMFAHSYRQHRSLKWAVIEHAAYGCMLFTVGVGIFFVVNAWRANL
jgi:hypothetical protein